MISPQTEDAQAIWWAGVDAVRSDALVRSAVRVGSTSLALGSWTGELSACRRLLVVGAGKAGAGMAAGLEAALGSELLAALNVAGWVNVPADCVRPLRRIHLHAARAAGRNEPAEEGVAGALRMLDMVEQLTLHDVCVCLISGGGSALLPAPRDGITLEDLLHVTRELSARGATIEQLNKVRKRLSRIQGGGLARACRAGALVTLLISDVLGDPLPIIASGPTVVDEDPRATRAEALALFDQFRLADCGVSPRVREVLRNDLEAPLEPPVSCRLHYALLGNNDTATAAAAARARAFGYVTTVWPARGGEETAEAVGRRLAGELLTQLRGAQPGLAGCLISGGEPVVNLAPADQRGLGGRNQQLILAALDELLKQEPFMSPAHPVAQSAWAILSGGTDGEDGPTDAAGGLLNPAILRAARAQQLDPADALRRNDAYHVLRQLGALWQTGPTHTNVCDVRIVVWQAASGARCLPA